MKDKRTIKLIEKAVQASFIKGKLDDKKVNFFLKEFKKMNISSAIQSITLFLKGLKAEQEKHTLTIESSTKLDPSQIKNIEELFKKDFDISKTEVKINPSLLGGVKVKIADTIFDNSLKGKIEQIGGAIRS